MNNEQLLTRLMLGFTILTLVVCVGFIVSEGVRMVNLTVAGVAAPVLAVGAAAASVRLRRLLERRRAADRRASSDPSRRPSGQEPSTPGAVAPEGSPG